MTSTTKGNQGEGVAVFKLIGYFKTYKEANKFANDTMRKTIGKDKYQIYQKQKMMLWGTEYDSIPKGDSRQHD